MKFCTQQQILNWMNVMIKYEKFALDRLRVRPNVFLVASKFQRVKQVFDLPALRYKAM